MGDQVSKKTMTGVVVSNKMDKTIVVKVERRFAHPVFKKVVKTTKKYKVHDENNECKNGDIVSIIECKPHSKNKKFEVIGDSK